MTREKALEYFQNKTVVLTEEEALANAMAIKALEQEPKIIETIDFAINASNGDSNYFVGLRNGMRYVKSLIDGKEPQFESCAEQEPKTEWIPVCERLPKKNIEVLVTTEWGCITIGEMFSNNDWFIHEGATSTNIDDIKAWMPLPKPYQSEVVEDA